MEENFNGYSHEEMRLALMVQKKLRGNYARSRARIMRYERYQSAALTIQWAYRAYRVIQLSRRRIAVGVEIASNKMAVGQQPLAVESKERWKRLLGGEASFQEKTDLWRCGALTATPRTFV